MGAPTYVPTDKERTRDVHMVNQKEPKQTGIVVVLCPRVGVALIGGDHKDPGTCPQNLTKIVPTFLL